MDLNDVEEVYKGRISSIDCSKYCKDPTPDAKQKEQEILEIYEKARESFNAAI
ncbi:MAG: hypothetical protein KatS3mg129_0802 [Leptospiraceae bacterium]|nr:MAG: hypothetical protein KatS3mg129_0802 [Leptospiraceae bacterium]